MRKFSFLSVFVLIFFIYSATGFANSYKEKPFQLLLSGVASFTNNKDMNDWADATTIYVAYINSISNYSTDTSKAKTATGFDFEFRYFPDNLWDLGFGLQIGSHTAKAESKLDSPGLRQYTCTYELTVIPIVANLYYRIDFESSNGFMLLGGGLGYYFGEMKLEEKGVPNPASLDGKQSKIGFQLLAEYDYVFDIGFTLFGGIKYRYVQFDKFDGDFGDFVSVASFTNKKFKAGLSGVALYIGLGYSF